MVGQDAAADAIARFEHNRLHAARKQLAGGCKILRHAQVNWIHVSLMPILEHNQEYNHRGNQNHEDENERPIGFEKALLNGAGLGGARLNQYPFRLHRNHSRVTSATH